MNYWHLGNGVFLKNRSKISIFANFSYLRHFFISAKSGLTDIEY